MTLDDEALRRLEWAATNAELPAYFATVLDAVSEIRETRALLATQMPCGFDEPHGDPGVPYLVAPFVVFDESTYSPDEAIAIGAALVRAGLAAKGGRL